eukprot:Gb_33202 [translate_table: standard]
METLTVEELALQRIFDLKNEVVSQFESHQRLFDEVLLSNVFLKNLEPPAWLAVNTRSSREVPNLVNRRSSRREIPSSYYSDGKRIQRQDSINSIRERFSELYSGFFCNANNKRVSSSVDRPAYGEVPFKKPRVEEDAGYPESGFVEENVQEGFEENADGDTKIDGNRGEQVFTGAQLSRKGEKQDLGDIQLDTNGEIKGSQAEEKTENVKSGEGKPRQRGAKKKKENAAPVVVGRVTRSRAKQCQILASAKKESGKRKAEQFVMGSEQPQNARNTRAKRAKELVVSDEPQDVNRPSTVTSHVQIEDNAGQEVVADGENMVQKTGVIFASSTPNCLRSSKDVEFKSAQLTPKTGSKKTSDKGDFEDAPQQETAQLQVTSEILEYFTEERVSTLRTNSWKTSDNGSIHDSQQKENFKMIENPLLHDTSEMLEKCREDRLPTLTDCRRTSDNGNFTDSKHQETLKMIENTQLQETLDTIESAEVKKIEEKCPSDFKIAPLQEDLSLTEKDIEVKLPSISRQAENQTGMTPIPVASSSVSKTCTLQEVAASQCLESHCGEDDLVDGNLKNTTPLLTERPFNDKLYYSGKASLSMASEPLIRSSLSPPLASVVVSHCLESFSAKIDSVDGDSKSTPPTHQRISYNGQTYTGKATLSGISEPLMHISSASPLLVVASDCCDSLSGKADLVDGGLKGGTPLIQERACNSQTCYSAKAALSNASGPLAHTSSPSPSSERLVSHDMQNEILLPQSLVVESHYRKSSSGNVDLVDGGLKGMPPLLQERPCNSQTYNTAKVGLSVTTGLLAHTSPSSSSERSVSDDMQNHPLSSNGGLLDAHGKDVILDTPGKFSLESSGHKLMPEGSASVMPELKVLLKNECECMEATGASLENISCRPSHEMTNQDKADTALPVEGDKCEKNNSHVDVGFVHSRQASLDSRLGLPCCIPDKNDGDITLDSTNSLMKRSTGLDFFENSLQKSTTTGTHLFVCKNEAEIFMAGEVEQNCKKQISLSRFRTSCGSSEKLLSHGVSQGKVRASDSVLAISLQDEAAKEQHEALHNAPSNTPRGHSSVDSNADLRSGALPNDGKLFSRSMLHLKEVGRTKLQHMSWPEYQFSRKSFSSPSLRVNSEASQDQLAVSVLSSPIRKNVKQSPGDNEYRQMARLLLEEQLKSKECCSSIMLGPYPRLAGLKNLAEVKHGFGNNGIRSSVSGKSTSKTNKVAFGSTGLPQVGVDGMHFQVTGNHTSAACLQDRAHPCDSSLKPHSFWTTFDVASPQGGLTEGNCKFLHPDISEFSFHNGPSGIEKSDMTQFKPSEKEPGEIFSGDSEMTPMRKRSPSLEADCQLQVNFPIDGLANGAGGSLGMLQLSQPCSTFSSTNQTVDLIGHEKLFQITKSGFLHHAEILKEFEGFNPVSFSSDGNFSEGKGDEWVGKDKGCQETQSNCANYSFLDSNIRAAELGKAFSSLTPAPNRMMKFRSLTPSDLHWSRTTELQEHSERSGEYWGKSYTLNDSYTAFNRSSTNKFESISGFNGSMGFGSKVKSSAFLTPLGGKFFDRISTNFMETDTNLFSKQVPMNQEHVGCFRIEEEIGVEEENTDHHVTKDEFENRIGSSTKKRVLGPHNALIDSGFAKQNSPLVTPAGKKFVERISTNSNFTDTRSILLSKQDSMNQKDAKCALDTEEDFGSKENRDPCALVNELQKRCGSSMKKKVLRNHNARGKSNIVSQIQSPKSNQKSTNILCNMKSFVPLVQQKQAAAAILTGKREVKVKALEAAEAAKRLEEKKEQERKMRKELVRREHEKIFHEKSREERNKGEREAEETARATSDCSNKSISSGVVRKKPKGGTLPKSHVDNSSQLETSTCGVDFKLKRALEAKTKLEQEKVRKLEEEQRRKEEERKKKEAEVAAKRRKREEVEKKDREEKRKRLEESQRQQKELEEQLRAEKEEKEQRRKVVDEFERRRKAMEEEAKKQRRIEKEKEAAERRRRMEEEAKAIKLAPKDGKHVEEICQHHEAIQAQKGHAGKVSSMSNSFAKCGEFVTEGQSMVGVNEKLLQSKKSDVGIQSYEISPYKGSDEDEDEDDNVDPGKFIPLWARKENLIPHLISQQHIDPDEIFTGAKTCSLNEVFGTNGSFKRRDFNRRSHSGEWLNDSFTWKEEYQYKLQMGYINKAK